VERREGSDLELRDESGAVFECDFIRITDLFDMNAGVVDDMSDTEEEEEAAFQIHLSSLSGEEREQALAERAEMDANIQADIEILLEGMQDDDDDDEKTFGSAWPPTEPQDSRWDTMQYLLQVHLKAPVPDRELFPDHHH
jgi:hypothetical protein